MAAPTPTPPPVALVTGATAGIGAEFARQLAARGFDLVIVARDASRLEDSAARLIAEHGISVEVLAADLTASEGLSAVEARLSSQERPIGMLVNNAGFGLGGSFEENPIEDEDRLLELLVRVPMRLTHAALRQMLPRRRGTIVQIASVAGYTPRSTYGAAKAWLLSFGRWANLAYRRRGVTVTTVAPGFVHTEFHDRMGAVKDGIPRVMWLSAERVVTESLRAASRGRAVLIPSKRYRLLVAAARILPASVTARGGLRMR